MLTKRQYNGHTVVNLLSLIRTTHVLDIEMSAGYVRTVYECSNARSG